MAQIKMNHHCKMLFKDTECLLLRATVNLEGALDISNRSVLCILPSRSILVIVRQNDRLQAVKLRELGIGKRSTV